MARQNRLRYQSEISCWVVPAPRCLVGVGVCVFSFQEAAFLCHLKVIIIMAEQYAFMLIYYNLLVFPIIVSFSWAYKQQDADIF